MVRSQPGALPDPRGRQSAMSHQNVEIVRRLNEAHRESGPSGFLRMFAEVARPDVEWREDPAWPGADTYHGVEQVRGFFADRFESFDFGVAEALEAVGLRE